MTTVWFAASMAPMTSTAVSEVVALSQQAALSRQAALSQRDADILEFERHWWKSPGAKDQTIRERFDMSPTRYYQCVNDLIDTPEALAADPLLVKRLRRLRAERRKNRSASRLAGV